MLKIIRSALLAGLTLLACAAASAQTDSATAEALMRSSGLWQQLDGVAEQVRAGMSDAARQGRQPLKPAEIDRLNRTVDRAFAAPRLRAIALSVIAKGTNPDHVEALQAWYRSERGTAFTKLEEAASVPDGRDPRAVMQADMALLSSLPTTRQALLADFVEAAEAGEAITNMTIDIMLAVQAGVTSAQAGSPAPSTGEMRAMMDAQRPEMLKAFTAMALASFARIYAPASDADMAAYTAFMKTPAGKHFMALGLRAMDAAMVNAAGEIGRGIPGAKEGANT